MEEVEGSTFPGADLALVAGDGAAGGCPVGETWRRRRLVALGSGESGEKITPTPLHPLKSPVPTSVVVPLNRYCRGGSGSVAESTVHMGSTRSAVLPAVPAVVPVPSPKGSDSVFGDKLVHRHRGFMR